MSSIDEFTTSQVWTRREKLTRKHFDILMLRSEGKSYPEIGLLLVLPKGTVKSRLHRARQCLRGIIQTEIQT